MRPPDSTLGGELADLRRRVAALQTACEKAQRSEAEMRRAIAGLRSELNQSLGVLVPLVDLMLLEAEERGLPPADLKDLAVLQRHLERLCREAVVAIPAVDDGTWTMLLTGHNGSGPDS
jgi:signal transduction histidine kinase